MRTRVMTMAAVIATTIGLSLIPGSALAKSCGGGYTHAVIGRAQKCLRSGEYCATWAGRQYHRYGFNCVPYPGGVHRLMSR